MNLIIFKRSCHKQYDKQHAFQGQQCVWVFPSLCPLFTVIFAHFWQVPVASSSPRWQWGFSPPKAANGAGCLSMLQAHVCYGQDAHPCSWKHPGPSLFVHGRLLGDVSHTKPSWDMDSLYPETWQDTRGHSYRPTAAPQNWKPAGLLIPLWQGIEFWKCFPW